MPKSPKAPAEPDRESSNPPLNLERSVVALPLLREMKQEDDKARKASTPPAFHNVIIDVNLNYPGGRAKARDEILSMLKKLKAPPRASMNSEQYVFCRLRTQTIRDLVALDREETKQKAKPAIFRVWLDHEVKLFTNKSISTVKADAARNAFGALGSDIVWAVVDTGVDGDHPHFRFYGNLDLNEPLDHRDFTDAEGQDNAQRSHSARTDVAGHGTHVAGIIAGEFVAEDKKSKIVAAIERRSEGDEITPDTVNDIPRISGMAPQCKILSLKVLDDQGHGLASNIIAALEYIQELNSNGRRILVHGVNLSVGYDFEPKWYACGQSPLCIEVDRLVRSGVVVVVAAGNTGYGFNQAMFGGPAAAGLDLTINDPGNAERAITVGSTHRDSPHQYGVSYFSSKGPTGDGRLKPDLVAPGERIISCQSSGKAPRARPGVKKRTPRARQRPAGDGLYKEDSGTSMAAPHVSGVIAAFLSIRPEFIGKADAVKEIFLATATDLKRAVYFQGKGLVDLMRAIQSV